MHILINEEGKNKIKYQDMTFDILVIWYKCMYVRVYLCVDKIK